MNRGDFLKKLGIGIGVAAISPRLLAEKEENSIGRDTTKDGSKFNGFKFDEVGQCPDYWSEESYLKLDKQRLEYLRRVRKMEVKGLEEIKLSQWGSPVCDHLWQSNGVCMYCGEVETQ